MAPIHRMVLVRCYLVLSYNQLDSLRIPANRTGVLRENFQVKNMLFPALRGYSDINGNVNHNQLVDMAFFYLQHLLIYV
ncbi:MAG: hypothetical protein D3906_18265 [Candidatus Electrothrix sp. AUS1_2]|nr:hypothetical protein [Candidatus Electrothrix sp. AUS1_2]